MCMLSKFLPLTIQNEVLACCDGSGIVADDERVVDIIAEHVPPEVLTRWADDLATMVCKLWREWRATER